MNSAMTAVYPGQFAELKRGVQKARNTSRLSPRPTRRWEIPRCVRSWDDLAGDQRTEPDAEGQRQQHQAGFRRRGAAHRAQIDRQKRDQ